MIYLDNAAAVATSSMATELVKGKSVQDALTVTNGRKLIDLTIGQIDNPIR